MRGLLDKDTKQIQGLFHFILKLDISGQHLFASFCSIYSSFVNIFGNRICVPILNFRLSLNSLVKASLSDFKLGWYLEKIMKYNLPDSLCLSLLQLIDYLSQHISHKFFYCNWYIHTFLTTCQIEIADFWCQKFFEIHLIDLNNPLLNTMFW